MYHILIVDDEPIEREGISFLIQKYQLDLDLKTAENGEVALDYLSKNETDILLTDIKMPFMDGLELSKNALKLKKDLKIIIFSAYSDFDYAKTSITLGVSDYLLKPINTDEFQKVMNKIIGELDDRNEKSIQKQALIDTYQKSIAHQREHILFSLINGLSIEYLSAKSYDLSFLNDYTRMMLIEYDNGFFEKCDKEFRELLQQILKCDYDYMNIDESQSVILLKKHTCTDEEFLKIGNQIYENTMRSFNCPVYVVLGHQINSPDEISNEISSFEQMLEFRFIIKDTHVFSLCTDFLETDNSSQSVSGILENIKYYVKMKDCYSLNQCMDLLCKGTKYKNDFSHLYIKFIFSEALKNIYESLPTFGSEQFNDEIRKIYVSNNLTEILEILKVNINKLNTIVSKESTANNKEVELVKQYIYSNFGSELTLNSLAEMVFLTPNYLSYIFKKSTGCNLNRFIKNYRMEKAKELLENTNTKISDVGIQVGYANASYFCQSFRGYYGISPERFRQEADEYA